MSPARTADGPLVNPLRAARATGAGLFALLTFCLALATPAAAASPADPGATDADLEDAIVALQSETLVLVELDAFATVPPRLRTIHDEYASYLDGLDATELHQWLEDADQQGADALQRLRADGVALSDPTVHALSPLSRATMDAFRAGSTVSLPGPEWAAALGELETLAANGSDPGLLTPEAPTASPAPVPAARANTPPVPKVEEGASPGLVTAALLIGGAALAVAVSVAAVQLSRRRRSVATEADADSALAAGRRLAEATDRDRLRAVVLAEVCALTGAEHAAWLCDGGDVADTAPSQAPLSDEAIAVLDHVADTAQSRTATAAWRSGQPECALLAVAVTGRGRVWGALVARRGADRPFEAAERVRFERLAPWVATAHGTVERHHTLAELSLTDGLTALANRRRLDSDLSAATASSMPSVGFVMLDVDHFKTYNDTHGHPAGDELLRRLAAVLNSCVRRQDVVYRYGGEEFAVLMPGADLASARDAAERIRATIADADLPGAASQPGGRVTVSVGVAVGPGGDAAALHLAADSSLYEAKRLGRNRVVTAGDDPDRAAADA